MSYKITEQDKQLFNEIEDHKCKGISCRICPYYVNINVMDENRSFCTLAYIHNRLIKARESEG